MNPQLQRLEVETSIGGDHDFAVEHASSGQLRAQMLDHFTQSVGSAPDQSPAILCGIAHMQTDEGVWYPLGGTGAIPRALTRLAENLGVEIRAGCGVSRILTHASTAGAPRAAAWSAANRTRPNERQDAREDVAELAPAP